jgi:[acyl-carrier-protein] S-malonyltransferase
MTTAVLFPGQGSLTPDSEEFARGIWPELADLACDLCDANPWERAGESTAYAQPAIYVTSLAGWYERRLEPSPLAGMAGHSLGEFSALAAAGALDPIEGLRLVVQRGQLMARAAAESEIDGGMVALLGGSYDDAAGLADEFGLAIANDNAPGQLVLSGDRAAIDSLTSVARSQGFKALALDVAGAFHSPAIRAAQKPFHAALRDARWQAPAVPVVSGCTAKPFEDFAAELARALVSPVRWRDVMTALYALGAVEFVDVGPGRVLERLVARNPRTEEENHAAVA